MSTDNRCAGALRSAAIRCFPRRGAGNELEPSTDEGAKVS